MIPAERQRPLLVFDGDCGFCRAWVDHWRRLTGDAVDYAPFQEVAHRFPDIARERFEGAVQLVLVSGEVLEGAEAVFRVLSMAPGRGWLDRAYGTVPGLAGISEAIYRTVARRRGLASRVHRWLWGERVPAGDNVLVRWLLLRGIGVVYLAAFVSFWVQIPGLVGDGGILPAGRYLEAVGRQGGWGAVWEVPTLGWLRSDTFFLQAMAAAGTLAAALAVLGVLTLPALVACWVLWLSLVGVGQEFLAFQWDILLLEAGFLAIFLAPATTLTAPATGLAPRSGGAAPRAFVWLFRLLLFRLMFSSGVVKLLSGDPTWRDLSALQVHFETQPLPTPPAWFVHQLPDVLLRWSTGAMFAVELALPFLYFAPRRPRLLAAAVTVLFQGLIVVTGNYAYFNLLTVVLCVALLDDGTLRRLVPPWRSGHRAAPGRGAGQQPDACGDGPATPAPSEEPSPGTDPRARSDPAPSPAAPIWKKAVAALILVLGLTQLTGLFVGIGRLPFPLPGLYRLASPLRVVNGYGLFAIMTTTRPEIVVEGSRDGREWRAYRFPYKPGELHRAPPWVAPHQPRLDWQMWFAALGGPGRNRWFVPFMERLLEGSPEVLALLETNPFPDEPPRYVRAVLYRYRFTAYGEDGAAVGEVGDWWRRERLGTYLPQVSLDDLR